MSTAEELRAFFKEMANNGFAAHALIWALINLHNKNEAMVDFSVAYNRENALVALVDEDEHCILVVSETDLSPVGRALAETLATSEHFNYDRSEGPGGPADSPTSLVGFALRAGLRELSLVAHFLPSDLLSPSDDDD